MNQTKKRTNETRFTSIGKDSATLYTWLSIEMLLFTQWFSLLGRQGTLSVPNLSAISRDIRILAVVYIGWIYWGVVCPVLMTKYIRPNGVNYFNDMTPL